MFEHRFRWTSAGATNVGCVRRVNEDTYVDLSASGLWVVADGMGGHAAGDYASGLIAEALSDVGQHEDAEEFLDDVERRLNEVNRRLFERSIEAERTMGSTVAAVLAFDNSFVALWAGDSRVYCRSSRGLEQVTRDHSQVEELVAMGELAREDADNHPMSNVITRAVGGARRLRLEARLQDIGDGDRVLVCSDGLFKDLKVDDLDRILASGSPREAVTQLIDEALLRGGGDNITAVVIDFEATA
ncbi:MAG: PP2C family serine/threonine-protein phosphatase [Gammaproteobacteria bacterium]